MEAIYKKAPPAFAVAEINWPIHSVYPFFPKPFFCGVKKEVGSLLVIDTFEKAASAHRQLVAVESIVAVECGDAADESACVVAKQPAGAIAGTVMRIGVGVEYMLHVAVKWPDVVWVMAVS